MLFSSLFSWYNYVATFQLVLYILHTNVSLIPNRLEFCNFNQFFKRLIVIRHPSCISPNRFLSQANRTWRVSLGRSKKVAAVVVDSVIRYSSFNCSNWEKMWYDLVHTHTHVYIHKYKQCKVSRYGNISKSCKWIMRNAQLNEFSRNFISLCCRLKRIGMPNKFLRFVPEEKRRKEWKISLDMSKLLKLHNLLQYFKEYIYCEYLYNRFSVLYLVVRK